MASNRLVSLYCFLCRAGSVGHPPPRDKDQQLASRKCRRESTPPTQSTQLSIGTVGAATPYLRCALPLLRHTILNDDKSSTYKLALLRAVCRIADGAAGYVRDADDGHVAVPLGLVGLYWIRLFKPLLAAGLPQSPTNQGDAQLGFIKAGFRQLNDVSHLDLRIGKMRCLLSGS